MKVVITCILKSLICPTEKMLHSAGKKSKYEKETFLPIHLVDNGKETFDLVTIYN